MGILNGLFRRSKKAIVFVDYEYWFYSYKTRFSIRPDPAMWRASFGNKYYIDDIMVFADFSSPGLGDELIKLREVTNTIIETGSQSQRRKKDMTDFVMLDYIYQFADNHNSIDTYILFTGDGHFQSVIKYLVQKKHKKVIVYGVHESTSRRLQAVASDVKMFPLDEELFINYEKMIAENMAFVVDKPKIIPTFKGTVDAVATANNVPAERIKEVLSRMIDEGYIIKKEMKFDTKTVKTIAPNWTKLINDGLWSPKKEM